MLLDITYDIPHLDSTVHLSKPGNIRSPPYAMLNVSSFSFAIQPVLNPVEVLETGEMVSLNLTL